MWVTVTNNEISIGLGTQKFSSGLGVMLIINMVTFVVCRLAGIKSLWPSLTGAPLSTLSN